MIQLHLQTRKQLNSLIAFRKGEKKLGEHLKVCTSLEQIKSSDCKYVVFGIAESIGVLANYGNPGTHRAWNAFLKAFVNVQSNTFNQNASILVLGHITVTPDEPITSQTPKEKLGVIVSRIDNKVAQVIETIVCARKIPIIIGGGHNNALGNIKGTCNALNQAINVLNIDAHTDLRYTDYRHSGNGFSHAFKKENGPALDKYAIFGLHKNYTPQYIFDNMHSHQEKIRYVLFEDMLQETNIIAQFESILNFVKTQAFGLELDCDAIKDFPSSAQTPSGLLLNNIRTLIIKAASSNNCRYFHICEAAPSKNNHVQVGKALSYFVTDFIRSHNEHNYVS